VADNESARVSDVLGTALSGAVARFDANEPALWTERDPEAVHQARVATRRVRSDLRTLHEFVDTRWAQRLRGELRWLGAELGAVRDIEVLLERLSLHADLLPDTEAHAASIALRRLRADHVAARTDLLRSLRSARYAEVHRTLHDAVARPRVTPAADRPAIEALPDAVRPTWKRLRRAADLLGPVPSDAALHEVRIRAKRCRYASELASPVMGRPAKDLASALTRVQDVLGEHQDAVVADGWIGKAAPECSSAEAYALGMLAEIERGFAVRARAAFASVWDAANAESLRSWL
jgi:CHAD domain-containing protein